ncbi:1-deoxy-D-xylulose-5-phosphate synthase N-terminal domain-containing protein, partial [Streptomyces clavuligerus]
MNQAFRRAALAALDRLTPAEAAVVRRELAELERGGYEGPLPDQWRRLAAAVPERLYHDSARLLLRMHQLAGSGNLSSNLSSLAIVRACFDLGLVPPPGEAAPDGNGGAPAELVVGRGHIAPVFHAEHYVRGHLPFLPLTTLHRGGLSGVVSRTTGFANTMRYSLGVGVAQATSLAWDLARRGSDRKVVCLAGDGELQEGVVFECLRFAHEHDLDRLILVVDANGKGIEPLPKPLSAGYLAAFLGRVRTVDGGDSDAVARSLRSLLDTPGRGALVCRTRKGEHSYRPPRPPEAPPVPPSFAAGAGRMLAGHRRRTGRELAVFTADMAGRFGLPGRVPYTNTGLAESLAVGLTLSLPDPVVKVVATDAMYYMDSLSMLTEATTGVRNLVVLAGRSWGAWGGAHNATNLLGGLLHTRVYEPVTEAEFAACLDRAAEHPAVTHVLSMVDARFEPPAADCSADPDGAVWITPPPFAQPVTPPVTQPAAAPVVPSPVRRPGAAAVVSFGYASTLVAEANRGLGIPHLHCAALVPELPAAVLAVLAGCDRLLTVEYNGADGGFGEGLRRRHLLPATVHAVRQDIANCVHGEQLRRHGMTPPQLRELLLRTTAGDGTGSGDGTG